MLLRFEQYLREIRQEFNNSFENMSRNLHWLFNEQLDVTFMDILWLLSAFGRSAFEGEVESSEDDLISFCRVVYVLVISTLVRLNQGYVTVSPIRPSSYRNANLNISDNIDSNSEAHDTDDSDTDDSTNIPDSYNAYFDNEIRFWIMYNYIRSMEHFHRQPSVFPRHAHFHLNDTFSQWNMDSGYSQTPLNDSIVSENHILLEKIGVPEDWIPDQFKCPITAVLIDGTPAVAPVTPHRFDLRALLIWLESNPTNPLNRDILYPQMLEFDYLLECKIRVFIECMCANIATLKSIFPPAAKQKITLLVEKIDHIYERQFKNHESLIIYTNNIIQSIKEKAANCDSSRALILFIKEPAVFKSISAFKLNVSQNQFQFYKPASAQLVNNHQGKQQDKYIEEFINLNGSCYELLNIPETATESEIVKAYKQLSLRIHPDRNLKIDASEKFKQLNEAKDILTNEELRNLHDARILQLLHP